MAKLAPHVFLEKANHRPVLDVRSPAEYAAGHIPGAYSFPLFDNQERAQVGTTYKQVGSYEALLVGLELVGPKMRTIVERAHDLAVDNEVLVHCWRGGMRSESVAWLLGTAGLTTHTLTGGYKAYRNHLLERLRNVPHLLVLGGATGSGKTATLHALRERGEQVIDLEALAHHRGSAFGGIGQGKQPTTEQFQNDLHQVWASLNPNIRVWVEDESFSIGSVKLPLEFWQVMQTQPLLLTEVPSTERVQRLVAEYGGLDTLALERAILMIQKRLGGLRTQNALLALERGRLDQVASILLEYYDKSYQRSLKKARSGTILRVPLSGGDICQNASRLIEAADQLLSLHKP